MNNLNSNQKNVVIGTGPLGLWVMDELLTRGREVTLVNRSGHVSETLPQGVELKTADCTKPEQVRQVCGNADVVFMCGMPPYTDWPEKFPPLMRGIIDGLTGTGVKFVFGDNLYMYGDTNGQPIHEALPYAAKTRKGKVRAAVAHMLLDAHQNGKLNVTIGRASDFYGPRVRNTLIGEMFFEAALNGKTTNLLGDIDQPHTFTYIGDFAKALVTLSEHDEAFGKAWHVPSAPTTSTRKIVELIESELGETIRVRTANKFMVSLLGLFNPLIRETAEMIYEWEKPYVVENGRFTATFGNGITPHKKAIQQTVAWFKNRQ